MNGFGHRLKALRTKKGYTQARLGELLGISASAVGMYEQGRREPDSKIIMDIGRLFEVSADYLLSGDGSEPREVEAALQNMREHIKNTGGLMFNGAPLDERDTEKLFDAMLLAANLLLKSKEDDSNK